MVIHGSCHCGNISFRLDWEPDPTGIPARACDCSFCTKHGGVWTSNPQGALKIRIKDRSLVSEYVFGTQTTRFHICRQCGIVPVATSEIAGCIYAAVSVNAFDDVPHAKLRRLTTSFGSEDAESRLARRKRNWVSNVQFVEHIA